VRSRPISERRRLKRIALKKRASLIVKHGRQAQRIPCLVLDDSQLLNNEFQNMVKLTHVVDSLSSSQSRNLN
jgi:hypothetical protein